MKNSFDSFTTCELSDAQLDEISGGACPCPDGDDTSAAGSTTTSQEKQTNIYYYYYW